MLNPQVLASHILYIRAIKLFSRFLDDNEPVIPRLKSPIIVIGMHRSGTSLVTHLLEDLGVSMGKQQGKDTREDLFFYGRNELLFKLTRSTWDNPSAFLRAVEYPLLRQTFSKVIEHDLERFNFFPFPLSPNMQKRNKIWGFKDPRNSITLPIWLDIFPNAKVIHVLRNGHAVSSSIVRRGSTWLRNNKQLSIVSLNYPSSLDLWAEYILAASSHSASLSNDQFFEISYEMLLASPVIVLKKLSSFMSIEVDEQLLIQIAARVKNPQNPIVRTDYSSTKVLKAFDIYNSVGSKE